MDCLEQLEPCSFRSRLGNVVRCSHPGKHSGLTNCVSCEHCTLVVHRRLPPLILRLGNFSRAFVQHAGNAFRYRTQPEIDAIYETCKPCHWFNGTHCTHRKCGCPIKSLLGWLSKIAWKSSKCPIGKWPAKDAS